jgi:membrane-bound lytic murein transglycosylase D
MSSPARFIAYPLVMLSGAVVGATFLSVQAPFNQADAASGHLPSGQKPRPFRGRLGAETPELRELQLAEAEMFPAGYDRELSDPELWDPPLGDDLGVLAPSSRDDRFPTGQATGPSVLDGLQMPNLPVPRDPIIAKYIRYFTASSDGRRMLTKWVHRSGRFHQVIQGALRAHELPADIESVVYIESGFWPTARSKAGAVGLWQFMPKTARIYGLTVDKAIDERRAIWKSSRAAAKHLADLHKRFHSWDLALAAYNMGYERLSTAIADNGTDDFWRLRSIEGALPRETSLYVPKVLAVAVIVRNLEHFDLHEIATAPPLDAAAISVPPGIRLSMIARAAGTSLRKVKELNPEIRLDVTPDRGGPIEIHIPSKGLARARVLLPRLLEEQGDDPLDLRASPDFDWGTDEGVERGKGQVGSGGVGDSGDPSTDDGEPVVDFSTVRPAATQKQTDTSTAPASPMSKEPAPVSADEARPAAPDAPSVGAETTEETNGPAASPSIGATRVMYTVQPGDSVWTLSRVWGLPVSRIVRQNDLSDPSKLSVGRKLQLNIPAFKKPAAGGK